MQVWELIEKLSHFDQQHTVLINGQPIRSIVKDSESKAVRIIPYNMETEKRLRHWNSNDI